MENTLAGLYFQERSEMSDLLDVRVGGIIVSSGSDV